MANDESDYDSCEFSLDLLLCWMEADCKALVDMSREERVHAVSVSGMACNADLRLVRYTAVDGVGIGNATMIK